MIAAVLLVGYAIVSGKIDCIKGIFTDAGCGCAQKKIGTSTVSLDDLVPSQLSTIPSLTPL